MAIRVQNGAIDLTGWSPPQRNRIDRHGEPAIEKLPTQRSIKMLHPSGHVVYVALHNGSGSRSPNDPTALRIENEKRGKGFLPYGTCPQTLGLPEHLPETLRGKTPCTRSADDEKIGSEHPCKCIVETEKFRTALHNKKMFELDKRYMSKNERDQRQRDEQINLLEKNQKK
jgi:hypothetical protein